MRLFNRAHWPWFIFVLLASAAASVLYLANFHPHLLPVALPLPAFFGEIPPARGRVGGSPLGVAYGLVSLGIFVFAGLLGLRKKVPLWRIGNVQRWLRAHIWLTLLTIPLVVLHSGFRLGAPMTVLLMALYAVVMISGLYGLVLQHHLPRLMKERLPAETVYEQIPHIRAQLSEAAEKLRDSFRPGPSAKADAGAPVASAAKAATAGTRAMEVKQTDVATPTARAKTAVGSSVTAETVATPATNVVTPAAPKKSAAKAPALPGDPDSEALLADFLERQVLPYLRARRGARMRFAHARYADDTFRFVKLRVAETYRPRVEEMQAWCDERRMLDLQKRMHHWLHGWLFLHVPLSFLLIMLTAWHAYVALFRY